MIPDRALGNTSLLLSEIKEQCSEKPVEFVKTLQNAKSGNIKFTVFIDLKTRRNRPSATSDTVLEKDAPLSPKPAPEKPILRRTSTL